MGYNEIMNEKHIFKIKTSSISGIQTSWTTAFPRQEFKMDIPKEFHGPGNYNSPEDLYAASLGNCFLATFKVIAEKSKLNYESIDVFVELLVDTDNESKKMVMKNADFKVVLYSPENTDRALRLLAKTPENCMILNSVKTQLSFQYIIQ